MTGLVTNGHHKTHGAMSQKNKTVEFRGKKMKNLHPYQHQIEGFRVFL